MGLIMKFYAADPEMVVTLRKRMASVQTIEEASLIREQLDSYPNADFSLNFTIPDHTDALCQAMIVEGLAVSPSSLDLFGTPLWDDEAASVHHLPHTFLLALTQASELSIQRIAERWVNSILPAKSKATDAAIASQNALKALSDLRAVSSFALEHRQSLLLCIVW